MNQTMLVLMALHRKKEIADADYRSQIELAVARQLLIDVLDVIADEKLNHATKVGKIQQLHVYFYHLGYCLTHHF